MLWMYLFTYFWRQFFFFFTWSGLYLDTCTVWSFPLHIRCHCYGHLNCITILKTVYGDLTSDWFLYIQALFFRGKGKGGAPVVVIPDEPREKLLCGSNCVSAISQALCCAGATTTNIPLYEYIARLRFNQVILLSQDKQKKTVNCLFPHTVSLFSSPELKAHKVSL